MAEDFLTKYQNSIPLALDEVEREIEQLVPLEHQATVLVDRVRVKNELCDSIEWSLNNIRQQYMAIANRKSKSEEL